jgi:hypothetical protein
VRFEFFYNFFPKRFSFQEEMRDIWSKMYIGLHVKHPLFLSDFNGTWIFSVKFRKILKCQIFLKICAVGAADRHDETNSCFSQVCERAQKCREVGCAVWVIPCQVNQWKNPSHLWFYSYLVNLKYHGKYEKHQIFIIVYVVVFHL